MASVQFALNPATNQYQATVTLKHALPAGNYTLDALHPILDTTGMETRSGIRDTAGNALGLTGFTEATDGQDSTAFIFSVARSGSDTSVTGSSVTNATNVSRVCASGGRRRQRRLDRGLYGPRCGHESGSGVRGDVQRRWDGFDGRLCRSL